MRQWITLVETMLYESIDFEKTMQNFGQKLAVRVETDHSAKDSAAALTAIINADPTPNKQYTLWILRTYLNKGFNFIEDLERVTDDLRLFGMAKQRLPVEQRDINRYRSVLQLEEVLAPFTEAKAKNELNKNELTKIRREISVVYSGPEGKICVPKTQAAACYLGRNTDWCTAWGDHRQVGLPWKGRYPTRTNQFENYQKLYIIMPVDGSLFQFDLASAQLMDVEDDEVDLEEFNQKYPWVFDHIKFSENEQLNAVQRNGLAIRYIKNPSEAVQMAAVRKNGLAIKYIENPSEAVQMAAVRKNGLAIKYIENPSEAVQMAAVRQHSLAIRYIKNPSEAVQMAAVEQYGYAIEYIKNPSEAVQMAAVRHQEPE